MQGGIGVDKTNEGIGQSLFKGLTGFGGVQGEVAP